MTHPLDDQGNWSKPLTFVVPVKVRIMVDDPSNPEYHALFKEKVVSPVMNELRSILRSMDPSGKQLNVSFGEPVTLAEFEGKKTEPNKDTVNEDALKAALEKILKEKGLA